MLKVLNRVKLAVDTKGIIPMLSHFAFSAGRVHAFDGRVYIGMGGVGTGDFTVPAVPFLRAVEACGEHTPVVKRGEAKMTVSASGFKATLPIGNAAEFPFPELPAKRRPIAVKQRSMLAALRALRQFVGDDASRPWSASVLVTGDKATATNNIVLARTAHPSLGADAYALPVAAVDILLALGEEPVAFALTDTAATFWLGDDGDTVVHAPLVENLWPDVDALLTGLHKGAKLQKIDPGLLDAVTTVKQFCPDPKHPHLLLTGDAVATLEGDLGAVVKICNPGASQCQFHADPLAAVLSVATAADWGQFPRVPWKGSADGLPMTGAIVGIRR